MRSKPTGKYDDLPYSCRLVLHELEDADGAVPRQELLDRTGLPERTLKWAIRRLRDEDLVTKEPVMGDGRQIAYKIRT